MMAVGLKLNLVRFWSSGLVEMSMFSWDFEVDSWLRFWRWNLSKLCVRTHDMTSRSYFGKMNSTLGSVVPLAMFVYVFYCKNVFLSSTSSLIFTQGTSSAPMPWHPYHFSRHVPTCDAWHDTCDIWKWLTSFYLWSLIFFLHVTPENGWLTSFIPYL